MHLRRSSYSSQAGSALIEYAIQLAAIAFIAVLGITQLGHVTHDKFVFFSESLSLDEEVFTSSRLPSEIPGLGTPSDNQGLSDQQNSTPDSGGDDQQLNIAMEGGGTHGIGWDGDGSDIATAAGEGTEIGGYHGSDSGSGTGSEGSAAGHEDKGNQGDTYLPTGMMGLNGN